MSLDILNFNPPPKFVIHEIMRPFRTYFSPRFYGLDNFNPKRPALLISNHTIYGLTDGFFTGAELYERFGVFTRALVDEMHYQMPGWRDVVKKLGFIPGSREACRMLMDAGESVMVFPGGTREAFKHKGEAYKLTWKQRLGFARMAVENAYDIIPVAGVGGEEMYKILFDSQDVMRSPFGKLLKTSGFADRFLRGGEKFPPVGTGVGLSAFPRPERVYIYVGERISTADYFGRADDKDALMELRTKVETALYGYIDELKAYRENDTDEEWWRKMLKMF